MLTSPHEPWHNGLMGRPSKTEPFRALVQAALEGNPNALTVELLELVRAEGYDGSYSPFFTMVKSMRPKGLRECRECHTVFSRNEGNRRNSVFCSGSCKQTFHTKERATLPSQGKCYTCRASITSGRICSECRQRKNESQQKCRLEDRQKAIAHYGGKCMCTGCIETHVEFLAFDHVDGGGNQHRAALPDPSRLARWIIANNFPTTIRLLCHNCNCARGYYGYCPHEKEN